MHVKEPRVEFKPTTFAIPCHQLFKVAIGQKTTVKREHCQVGQKIKVYEQGSANQATKTLSFRVLNLPIIGLTALNHVAHHLQHWQPLKASHIQNTHQPIQYGGGILLFVVARLSLMSNTIFSGMQLINPPKNKRKILGHADICSTHCFRGKVYL